MNKLEAAYADRLQLLLQAGQIGWWRWNCLTLRLAKGTHYRTDFLVMQNDGTLEIHETKGHMEDDAWLKLKIVASTFPFIVKLVKRLRGAHEAWEITEVGVDAKASDPNRNPNPSIARVGMVPTRAEQLLKPKPGTRPTRAELLLIPKK